MAERTALSLKCHPGVVTLRATRRRGFGGAPHRRTLSWQYKLTQVKL